jgi:predicted Zn-dependent peptidase
MTEQLTLESGIQIAYEYIPFVHSVAFGIWIRNGSRDENPSDNGMSHFLEHMLFKGTETRTAFDIANSMDAIGGQMNGFTSRELTCYYARVLSSHIETAVDVLADMFYNSKFAGEDIEKERGVVYEEIKMYEDTPEDVVTDILVSKLWDNPLGYSVLGTEQTLSSFDADKIRGYMAKNYTPDKIVISVSGNFNAYELLKLVEKYFGGKKKIIGTTRENTSPNHGQTIHKYKDIEQAHITLAFPGIAIDQRKTMTFNVMNSVFGNSASSRLYQKIREDHGLVYAIYSYGMNFTDNGITAIYAGLSFDNIIKAVRLIFEEIEKIKKNGITESEIKKAKEQLKSNILMNLESTYGRMNANGRMLTSLGRIYTPEETINRVDAVDSDMINEMIAYVFDYDKISFSLVGKYNEKQIKKVLDCVNYYRT